MSSLLVVHIGAGSHSSRLDTQYKNIIKKSLLANEPDGKNAVINSSKVLDNYANINSRYGSCLDITGNATNDVSFVEYNQEKVQKYFSCHNVAHNSPLKETIMLYENIHKLYEKDLGKLGLMAPNVIDYSCKQQVETRLGISEPTEEVKIPPRQQKLYQLFQQGYLESEPEVQDTIGIMHRNHHTNTTILAASSGGNFLKLPGRIGCAGIIGAGLGYKFTEQEEINCLCSGSGEDIIMLNISNYIIDKWIHGQLDIDTFNEVIKSEADKYNLQNATTSTIYIGLILTIFNHQTQTTRLIYYHTTETFYFGFNHNHHSKIIQSKLDSHRYIIGEYLIR